MNCMNCGAEAPTTQSGSNYIDGGLSLDLLNMGHYGGLWDNFPADGREGLAHICHDCAVLFMRTFPGLAKMILPQGGGHPNGVHLPPEESDGVNTPSCCEYAWTWDPEEKDEDGQSQTYFGTTDGSWEKVVRVGNKLVRESCAYRQGML